MVAENFIRVLSDRATAPPAGVAWRLPAADRPCIPPSRSRTRRSTGRCHRQPAAGRQSPAPTNAQPARPCVFFAQAVESKTAQARAPIRRYPMVACAAMQRCSGARHEQGCRRSRGPTNNNHLDQQPQATSKALLSVPVVAAAKPAVPQAPPWPQSAVGPADQPLGAAAPSSSRGTRLADLGFWFASGTAQFKLFNAQSQWIAHLTRQTTRIQHRTAAESRCRQP